MPDTVVHARITGMNIPVLVLAFMEPRERDECSISLRNMENVVKVKEHRMT